MDPILAIIAGLIGASITGLIACRYRTPLDHADEVIGPKRLGPAPMQRMQFRLQGD